MENHLHYATVTDALNLLRKRGFTIDFNLDENHITCKQGKFTPDEFEIVDVYRYEGNTDPGDEATVYAIASRSGLKGVLVTGYGASSDKASDDLLRKLHNRIT